MAVITLINPATEEVFDSVETISNSELVLKIDKTEQAFKAWRFSPIDKRKDAIEKIASKLAEQKQSFAELMTKEMGKPISQSIAEVEKCVGLCEYYAENLESFLQNTNIQTEASNSYVSYEPLGICYAIMPWNFPLWQVMRFAVPAIAAGNGALLKHAPNVSLTALKIESLFAESSLPEHLFQSLIITNEQSEAVIKDFRVKSVNVTASEQTGSIVASIAGREIKKSVLELGGSDPFIVLNDADIAQAAKVAATSRLFNSGQTCISSKRFIIEKDVYSSFIDAFIKEFKTYKIGDPTKAETNIGPLARIDILELIQKQADITKKSNANLVYEGDKIDGKGFYFAPTIFTDVTPEMEIGCEETFGPLAAVTPAKNMEEALQIANNTRFGLGATVFTKDTEKAIHLSQRVNAGHVAINGMVKSDSRLPFGGSNRSGYGRELSEMGIKEFCNPKTIWIA